MKILVVDDHPLVLDALRLIVKKLERTVEVFSARSRDECLTQLRKVRDVDLMLLDLGGPGADGFSALREVRQAHPEIPLVVVSATDDSGTINEAIGLGAMGFIPKSSSPEVMLSALRLVLAGGIYLPPAALAARAQRCSGAGGAICGHANRYRANPAPIRSAIAVAARQTQQADLPQPGVGRRHGKDSRRINPSRSRCIDADATAGRSKQTWLAHRRT